MLTISEQSFEEKYSLLHSSEYWICLLSSMNVISLLIVLTLFMMKYQSFLFSVIKDLYHLGVI